MVRVIFIRLGDQRSKYFLCSQRFTIKSEEDCKISRCRESLIAKPSGKKLAIVLLFWRYIWIIFVVVSNDFWVQIRI